MGTLVTGNRNQMMKTILSALVISGFLVSPALSHGLNEDQGSNQRFSEMDQMMDRMDRSTSPAERSELMQRHMSLMSSQMGIMHEMTRGHRDSATNFPRMGAESMNERVSSMEDRMDLMQQVMEHMFAQQEMMLHDERE